MTSGTETPEISNALHITLILKCNMKDGTGKILNVLGKLMGEAGKKVPLLRAECGTLEGHFIEKCFFKTRKIGFSL